MVEDEALVERKTTRMRRCVVCYMLLAKSSCEERVSPQQ
jgi:hypothetical protein